MRLCQLAAELWPQISAAYYQINLLRVKPHVYTNLVYAWAIERVPHDDLDEWLRDLEDLLPWQDSSSASAVSMESESFMNMQAKGGG